MLDDVERDSDLIPNSITSRCSGISPRSFLELGTKTGLERVANIEHVIEVKRGVRISFSETFQILTASSFLDKWDYDFLDK